jgi:Fe-S cluster assembly iron-binding protein IscA
MNLNNKDITQIDVDSFPITFSKDALNIIKKAISTKAYADKFLRISVIGGGCSGLRYGLNFVSKVDKNDILCKYAISIYIYYNINTYCIFT